VSSWSDRSLSLVRLLAAGTAAVGAASCAARAPQAPPLAGTPTTAPLPATTLPPGHRRIVFDWSYREKVFSGHGQGVARIAPPDTARVDFFLENGAAAGYVILIGDSLSVPEQEEVRRYLPPVPLLWASLGRLAVSGRDTVAKVDGDTLRVDIGPDPVWRAAFAGNAIARLERIHRGRVEEVVTRPDSFRVSYRHTPARRTLRLTVLKRFEERPFDEAIWRR
jgi:hypothetical protein